VLLGHYNNGQKGAELLRSLAPDADKVSAWATLGYPKNYEEMKTNYYKFSSRPSSR